MAGLVLFAGACNGTAGTTSTSLQGVGSAPTASVGETDGDQEGGGASGDEGRASDVERYSAEGLTFLYPTEVYSMAEDQPSSATTDAVVVDLSAPSRERDGKVVVAMVRSAEGLDLQTLSDEDRAQLARLESAGADDLADSPGEPEGEALRFINGFGVKSTDGEVYRFEGLTDDGRFLVNVAGHGEDRAGLDRIVSSLYVDGATFRVAGEACDEAVELIDENGVPEGATFEPGQEVTATWEVRNTGTCTWGGDHAWVFTGGEPVAIVATDV